MSFKRFAEGRGFSAVYGRVDAIARMRLLELTCSCGGELHSWIAYRGWGEFGEIHRAETAFGMWNLACSERGEALPAGERPPTREQLSAPGGATPEVVSGFSPHEADEIYSSADFAEPSAGGRMTFSYGELIPAEVDDLDPFVRRAEAMVGLCAVALQRETLAVSVRPVIMGRTCYHVGPPHMAVVELHLTL